MKNELIDRLIALPGKIVRNHDLAHLHQIVLHYIGHEACFGLEKAAYFADNPDFDHLLGAAGYSKDECCYESVEDLWSNPSAYIDQINDGSFQRKIQKILKTSLRKQKIDLTDSDDLKGLAQELGMENPQFISWDLKHGNHGVLIYQANQSLDNDSSKLLEKSIELLGFCSI